MISNKLINPKSIFVVGGSNEIAKPGGKVLSNLLEFGYKGNLYVVNPKLSEVQGVKAYPSVEELPECDCAIIAIAAKYCLHAVEVLATQKKTQGFIILSAGFSEEDENGARIEQDIIKVIDEHNGSLIGPNCVGYMNVNYPGVFITPIPKMSPEGADFISGSGSTAMFIMETGIASGLSFNSIVSVGNGRQIGVEEMMEYMDETYEEGKSSKIKLLYIESIRKPEKLLKHARSLIKKGCRIAAVKSGSSAAGSRAATSHTGALAGSDAAVDALFRKAGIVRCHGRNELINVANIFKVGVPKGNNIGIITHAGGPGVMLTDALSNQGMNVPHVDSPELLAQLFPGSSAGNPFDYLVTGKVEHLKVIMDYCEEKFDNIDAMAVIYGNPHLFDVNPYYDVISNAMKTFKKPVYPILPSVINAVEENERFKEQGNVLFTDEVDFGNALGNIMKTKPSAVYEKDEYDIDVNTIRKVVDNASNGYISPVEVETLLHAAGIKMAGQAVVTNVEDAVKEAKLIGMPVVMKVVGPVHKSDVGGVALNVNDETKVRAEFDRMMKIKDTTAILIQNMLSGIELFAGAKKEAKFGHVVLCGLGGIFIEVLKDVQSGLAPLTTDEVNDMVSKLKGYKMLQGVRGQEGVNIEKFVEAVVRISLLVKYAPEITEMDLNPLLGNKKDVIVVDSRIRIEK